ncbi:MAG: hypothetical protein DMG57_17390 [Acidobacteria bacterium]|nr:MAG: hypothetical protein DMG57_17390 [Acidobacteriota bacterium]
MNCESVQRKLSAFQDRSLGPEAFGAIAEHLVSCRECASYSEDVGEICSSLRELPRFMPPARLLTQLQVLASRERAYRLSHNTLPALIHYWRAELRLVVDNLMRPFAIPFAGGLLSAVFLFSMLVPTFQFQRHMHNDVPSGLYTQSDATVDAFPPPFGFSENDVVVQLTLDAKGSVVDYSLPNGSVSKQMRNDIANMILFTKFQPATAFGLPAASTVLISFRRIVVKG